MKYLLVFLSFVVLNQCLGQDLGLLVLAPIEKSLADQWIKSLQDVYMKFLEFVDAYTSNVSALAIRSVREFQKSTVQVFNFVKGRVLNTLLDLEITVKQVTNALFHAIITGVYAVKDLVSSIENDKVQPVLFKVSEMMDKLEKTLKITTHLI